LYAKVRTDDRNISQRETAASNVAPACLHRMCVQSRSTNVAEWNSVAVSI